MQIGELARRIDVDYRAIRYVLERRHADSWIRAPRGRGHHRDLNTGEAFAVALLVKLKQAGLTGPKAEQFVNDVAEAVRGVARRLSWDPRFNPFAGDLVTDREWLAEVGDQRAWRILTNANPSLGGRLEVFGWFAIAKRRRALPDFRPVVVVRLDLSRLAERLRKA